MAERDITIGQTALVARFEEQLNCSICLDTYKEPKELQCYHIFCKSCLVKLTSRDKQEGLIISCPTCRQVTPVPANGVSGLQSAFNIVPFLEIKDTLDNVKPCLAPSNLGGGDIEEIPPATPARSSTYCLSHNDKTVELYCKTCNELICYKCAIKGGKHQSHDYESISEAFERIREETSHLQEPIEKQLSISNSALAELDAHCKKIATTIADIEMDIHQSFKILQDTLKARKTQLLDQLYQATQAELKELDVQRDHIETTQGTLKACLVNMRESVQKKTGSEEDLVWLTENSLGTLKKLLTTSCTSDMTKPLMKAEYSFTALKDLRKACETYGQVLVSGPPDPTKYTVLREGIKESTVKTTRSTSLQITNIEDESHPVPIASTECTLESESTGDISRGSVEREGQSQYIKGSPISVVAKLPVEKLGAPILTLTGLYKPASVAINKKGQVMVTEYDGQRVSVFTPNGKKLQSFASRQGQSRNISGIAIDDEGNVLMTDSLNHRIQKFTADGKFISALEPKGMGLRFRPPHSEWPKRIAINTIHRKIYVLDVCYRVLILNYNLTISGSFGKSGNSTGEFSDPHGLACDKRGNLYVADSGNHRIQVFTADGKFLKMFGRRGTGPGELGYPHSLTVDAEGFVYVSERDNHRVSVFNSESLHVTTIGKKGEGLGEFNRPMGLAVDSSGVVYACDYSNCCVQVF